MGLAARRPEGGRRDAGGKLAEQRRGSAITRASILIAALATLLAGCDSPFGPSDTDLQYGINDVAMVSQGGVDLDIRYDLNVRGFDGRLFNSTNGAVSVKVVVRLSNGRTYDQVFDLVPGEVHFIRISTFLERFTSWDVELSV